MSKYYAVAVGRTPGIYTTWDEARRQVDRFSDAKYKSFTTRAEAERYINSFDFQPPSNLSSSTPFSSSSTSSTSSSSSSSSSISNLSNLIISYCDGSCVNKVGGYGIVVLTCGQVHEYKGRVPYSPCTNNKAELYAILQVLELAPSTNIIRTDSLYSINCVTKWVYTWQRNGWKTSNGHLVENRELIEEIVRRIKSRSEIPLRFEHVYGHTGDKYNELTDRLANEGRTIG